MNETKLGNILKNIKEKYDPTKEAKYDIPYIGLENIEKGKGIISIGKADDIKSIKTKFKKGDLLYGKLRPYLDKHDIADFDGICSTDILVYRAENNVTAKWVNYFMSTTCFIDYAIENSNGINLPRTSDKAISLCSIPLPPLETQKRIVDRIESLFAKLDEAKEKAQTALDTFELRKSAILHKAFTGELTAKWRSSCRPSDISSAPAHIESAPADISSSAPAEHIDKPLPKEWKITTLAEIGLEFKYGVSEKSDYLFQGLPVLRIPNIGNGKLDFNDIKYLQSVEVNEEDLIHQNDILIIRSNGSRDLVGKCAIVPILTKKYAYASFLIRIKPSEKVLSAFLATYLNSNNARSQMFAKAKSSSGIHNINSKELGAIIIPLPPLPEQQEIVRILDDLLAKENAAKEAAEAVIEKIDLMKKSILARAFRGEL